MAGILKILWRIFNRCPKCGAEPIKMTCGDKTINVACFNCDYSFFPEKKKREKKSRGLQISSVKTGQQTLRRVSRWAL